MTVFFAYELLYAMEDLVLSNGDTITSIYILVE
jgi:hypothetical protein